VSERRTDGRTAAVVVVGASAGGVEALKQLVRGLPAGYGSAVLIVLHVPPAGTSVLPQILERAGRLPSAHARDGEPLEPGRIYVAPPDFHLTVEADTIRVVDGPKENGVRPAIDALFRTAAHAYGERVAGVILSGSLADGSAGLAAVKEAGGLTVVQNPAEASYAAMPSSAIDLVGPDHVLPVAAIAALLAGVATPGGAEPVAHAVPAFDSGPTPDEERAS